MFPNALRGKNKYLELGAEPGSDARMNPSSEDVPSGKPADVHHGDITPGV